MLGYKVRDLEVMIASIDIAMLYLEDHIEKETMAFQGLIDAASFLEGMISEGHLTDE